MGKAKQQALSTLKAIDKKIEKCKANISKEQATLKALEDEREKLFGNFILSKIKARGIAIEDLDDWLDGQGPPKKSKQENSQEKPHVEEMPFVDDDDYDYDLDPEGRLK